MKEFNTVDLEYKAFYLGIAKKIKISDYIWGGILKWKVFNA